MKKIPLLLTLCATFSLPAFAASDKTPEQYWADTGFNLDVMANEMHLFSPDNCYHSLPYFRGCVAALNALASRNQPAAKFVPASLPSDPAAKYGAKLNSFNGLAEVVVPTAPTGETLRVTWTRELDNRKKSDAGLEAMFNARASSPVDFGAIFAAIRPQVVKDKAEDPMIAGETASAFLTEAVDAHARIEPTQQDQDEIGNADQSFAGIGVPVQDLNGRKILGQPFDGSPALKAGIKDKDELTSVNGATTSGVKIDDTVKLIRGPEGSSVKLGIHRGDQDLEITVVRAKIVQENVESRVVQELGNKVGVIRLRSFMDSNACKTMTQKIKDLAAQKVTGLVLDLRGNGGGLVDQAVCLGGLFVGQKVIVQVKDLQTNQMTQDTSTQSQLTSLPLTVLIDSGSASASEILSGALQDHQRAWIVGERSFGKGSVQAPQSFFGSDSITLYHTVERFYQPSGRTNQIVGIQPDFVRPIKPDATEDDRFALRERDYFPTAMDAVNAPWTETRPDAVAKVEACVAQGQLAKAEYAKELAAGKSAPDFQLFSAEEILRCSK